jgi:hypothetical protein
VPFLRVIRDKRGYETTYLMHWYKEGSRQRSRILYVFRSPGGVRVGRSSLEPEILRRLESQHPDIEFDWKAVLDNQQVVEPAVDQRRPRKRRRDGEEEVEAGPAAAPAPVPRAAEPQPARQEAPSQQPPRPPIPAAIEGTTTDEQIAFLAIWYPRVLERVPQRTTDPARQEALLALCERLNTSTWTTDPEQVATGLQQAAEALERLARVFTRRRRRSRRPSAPNSPAEPPLTSDQ